MTTKVEPTVEKWEHAVVELLKSYIWTSAGHPVNLDGVDYSKMIKLLRTTIAHSVQEAKAEGFREGYERGKRELEPKYGGRG